jgi:hypothetical protein
MPRPPGYISLPTPEEMAAQMRRQKDIGGVIQSPWRDKYPNLYEAAKMGDEMIGYLPMKRFMGGLGELQSAVLRPDGTMEWLDWGAGMLGQAGQAALGAVDDAAGVGYLTPAVKAGGRLIANSPAGKAVAGELMDPNSYTRQMLADETGEIQVWHGSPHKFDKFSFSHMGEGEGHQAFGWGGYFSDAKDIAKKYAENLGIEIWVHGKPLLKDNNIMFGTSGNETVDNLLISKLGDLDGVIGALEKRIEKKIRSGGGKRAGIWDEPLRVAKQLKEDNAVTFGGTRNVYKATLHKGKDPSEYVYLDWDKPVSVGDLNTIKMGAAKNWAPELQKDFMSALDYRKQIGDGKTRGQFVYEQLSRILGSDREASRFLLDAGIDGIRYPSGTLSGIKKSDKYNYVVFDDRAITVDERISY